jgi:hypothetical protein
MEILKEGAMQNHPINAPLGLTDYCWSEDCADLLGIASGALTNCFRGIGNDVTRTLVSFPSPISESRLTGGLGRLGAVRLCVAEEGTDDRLHSGDQFLQAGSIDERDRTGGSGRKHRQGL